MHQNSPVDLQSRTAHQVPARGEEYIHGLLEELGEDPEREGLQRTPERVWRSLGFLTDGYGKEPLNVVGEGLFEEQYDEMVTVSDIEFYSMCEHHLLPFFGRIHVAYVPEGRIIGLSKVPRLVEIFTHRLQVQERLTEQIAEAMQDVLQPKGVAVVVEASHLCMMMRGVQKQSARTITSAVRGIFKSDARTRGEFLDLCRQR